MLSLESKFTKIIYKILKLKKTKSMNLKINQVSNWDSLNNRQLLIFLEKEFKLKFNENELSSFTS